MSHRDYRRHIEGPDDPRGYQPGSASSSGAQNLKVRLQFLGTGDALGTPTIECLTAPSGEACVACTRAQEDQGVDANRDRRRNTCAVVRFTPRGAAQEERTLLLSCPSTFRAAALEHGLGRIDAVILSSEQSDAWAGLEDLEEMVAGGAAATEPVEIWCVSRRLEEAVRRRFPALFLDSRGHGRAHFALRRFEDGQHAGYFWGLEVLLIPARMLNQDTGKESSVAGLLFERKVLWMPSTSLTPAGWSKLGRYALVPAPPAQPSKLPPELQRRQASSLRPRPLKLLVCPCSGLVNGDSPFPRVLELAHRLGVEETCFVNLAHGVSHACWLACSSSLHEPTLAEAHDEERPPASPLSDRVLGRATTSKAGGKGVDLRTRYKLAWNPAVDNIPLFLELARLAVREVARSGGAASQDLLRRASDVRPAWDGLTAGAKGRAKDAQR